MNYYYIHITDNTQKTMKKIIRGTNFKLDEISYIIEKCSMLCNTSYQQVRYSKLRNHEIQLARHFSCYFINQLLINSITKPSQRYRYIGEILDRDRVTILHSIKQITNWIEVDKKVNTKYLEIKTVLNGTYR